MADYRTLIEQKNRYYEKQFNESIKTIGEIVKETETQKSIFKIYSYKLAKKILLLCDIESKHDINYCRDNNLKTLQKINHQLFHELSPRNYTTSYLNPEYSVSLFGEELGPILSAFYASYYKYSSYVFRHKRYELARWNSLFIDAYNLVVRGVPSADELVECVTRIYCDVSVEDNIIKTLERYDPTGSDYGSIVNNSDFSDIRYLYKYGKNITKNEIETANFLANYPQEKVDKLAQALTEAYLRGFELAGKDISIKETVNIYYNIGQERIAQSLGKRLEERGLQPMFLKVLTTSPNRQFTYDHRFDRALYFDAGYVKKRLSASSEASEKYKDLLKKYSGPIYFDKFGENPFSPQQKKACLKLSDEQQRLMQQYTVQKRTIQDTYTPRSEMSFCIVAFPVPEIGEQFTEIFEETFSINMMDSLHYEMVQQKLVDELDKADYIHVKGKDGNKTDIKVKMQTIADPSKQTNFENCGANLNIPVGEAFTSPQLAGTNGVLHVKESYLGDLMYKDITLVFKDGYVVDYRCANFNTLQDNKKYIFENLLFPHKTLPLGEFAIGTNTRAYVMAKKHKILSLMPILIVEKMGPHFAIGDTCYSWEEDFKVYNPIDKKEITARDNEKSILRKTDVQKAYTNRHTDITLPYEELDFITAVTDNGEKIDILRGGRFVVPGTEELNFPLDEWEKA